MNDSSSLTYKPTLATIMKIIKYMHSILYHYILVIVFEILLVGVSRDNSKFVNNIMPKIKIQNKSGYIFSIKRTNLTRIVFPTMTRLHK